MFQHDIMRQHYSRRQTIALERLAATFEEMTKHLGEIAKELQLARK